MMYAVLCYNNEEMVCGWSREQDDAVMAKIAAVQERLTKAGKMGASLRLLPTTAATTLRKTQEGPLVIDGPFAETKEQLLGFYLVDAADLDDVLAIARDLATVNPGGTYEIRPVRAFFPDQRTDQKTGT